MPVSQNEYKIITPWSQRPKLFGNFGGLTKTRFSQKFAEKFTQTDLSMDVYSRDFKILEDRLSPFKNIHQYLRIPQDNMPSVLNEYKFFVCPHEGDEVFFITLLQAIMCGTIPLVMNDRNSDSFNPRWIDWAEGLYFGTNDEDNLIKNMQLIVEDKQTDFEGIANTISNIARVKFKEDRIKKEIIDFIS